MGSLTSLLLSTKGERSLSSAWGRWAFEVSRKLGVLESSLFLSSGDVRIDPATAPVPVAVGPTYGWLFTTVPQCFAYTELQIQPLADRSKPLIVGLGWAPAGSEAGKTAKWTLDIGLEREGSDVAQIDLTKSMTIAVPDTAAMYARTAFVLTAAEWDDVGTDELHVRITREASATDPALPPGLHHVVLLQYLKL